MKLRIAPDATYILNQSICRVRLRTKANDLATEITENLAVRMASVD
jgi:hypothetical protein